ncbi:MAG TPA: hypothetical protein VF292_11345 [Rhodanobacteraceae bacterium]
MHKSPRPLTPDSRLRTVCHFAPSQQQILARLCGLVPEQIEALERVLPRVQSQLRHIVPRHLAGPADRTTRPCELLAPRVKHRVVCAVIAMLDEALHAGFDAHYGADSVHVYAPRISASAKSPFLNAVNLCYDAVGFPTVSAAKAIDTYRRSVMRLGGDARRIAHGDSDS